MRGKVQVPPRTLSIGPESGAYRFALTLHPSVMGHGPPPVT